MFASSEASYLSSDQVHVIKFPRCEMHLEFHTICEEVVQPDGQTAFLLAKWHRGYS